jgi:tetratricopeptide (TPR) repeat protein
MNWRACLPTSLGLLRAARTLVGVFAVLALACAWMPAASALDAVKAAANMARKAAAAFEEGDHLKAAGLYLQAYASDPDTPEYIYGAARAEQVGGKLDLAEQHFVAYLAKPNATNRVENAKKFLGEVRSAKAEQRSSAADTAEKAGDLPLAAQLYADCRALAPVRWDCQFHEAVARRKLGERDAGERDHAILLLKQYLDQTPETAPDRGQARVLLNALTSPSAPDSSMIGKATPEPPKAKPDTPIVVAPGPESPKPVEMQTAKVVAWSTLGGGVALGLVGLGFVVKAAVDRGELNSKLDAATPSGYIEGITYADAKAAAATNHNRTIAGSVMAGVGLAAAGVGTWLVWRAYPDYRKTTTMSVVPGLGEAYVVVRF